MKVAAAQFSINNDYRANVDNIISFTKKAAKNEVKLIVFPELSNSGYNINIDNVNERAQYLSGEFVSLLKGLSIENNLFIVAGYLEKYNGKFYNSAVLIDNNGEVLINHRKIYLWKKENLYLEPGNRLEVIDTEIGKIGLAICYDLEFPETARILALKGAEIICAPSCFSYKAEYRWDLQMNANAVFNLLYLIGANVNDKYCCGKSKIIGPDGLTIKEASKENNEMIICDIDLNEIVMHREKVPYFKDYKYIIGGIHE